MEDVRGRGDVSMLILTGVQEVELYWPISSSQWFHDRIQALKFVQPGCDPGRKERKEKISKLHISQGIFIVFFHMDVHVTQI